MSREEALARIIGYLERRTASMAHNHSPHTLIVQRYDWDDLRKNLLAALELSREIEKNARG